MIKHILFDTDQTLYPASSRIEVEMIRRMNIFTARFLGITVKEAAEQRAGRDRSYDSTLDWLRRGKGLRDESLEEFFRTVHPVDFENFFPKNPLLAEMLSKVTVPCSILTNSWAEHAVNVAEYLEIRDYFENIFDLVFNNYKGKPNLSAFENVLKFLGLDPAEVLFIDDIPRFTDIFHSIGGKAILIDEEGLFPQKPGIKSVRYITEIAPVLKEYGLMKE
jgi:putative hydrolase of the HAD superfamily